MRNFFVYLSYDKIFETIGALSEERFPKAHTMIRTFPGKTEEGIEADVNSWKYLSEYLPREESKSLMEYVFHNTVLKDCEKWDQRACWICDLPGDSGVLGDENFFPFLSAIVSDCAQHDYRLQPIANIIENRAQQIVLCCQ